MVHFPLLKHLEIRNYGLFPGPKRNGYFDLKFDAGLTLILGANGLGKTTLMNLVFRLVAGTFDLLLPAEIGNTNLVAHELNRSLRRQFADRVNDGAQQATAELQFTVGQVKFIAERKLNDLSLQRLLVNDQDLGVDEKAYQAAILQASGLGDYADWLLILRTLVFFFEDRRALVWDPGAQRQLLRCLFLSPKQAREWTSQERTILELDSRMRNLQAALRREQRENIVVTKKVQNISAVRTALIAAQSSLEDLDERHAKLVSSLETGEEDRHKARLNVLRAQNEHDQAVREFERSRLFAVEAHLPLADESMRFIFARLMSDDTCHACGTSGVDVKRKALETALEQHRCLVCESTLPTIEEGVVDLGDRRIAELRERVESIRVRLLQQKSTFEQISSQFEADSKALSESTSERSDIQDTIKTLINQLPPDERNVNAQQDKLAAVAGLVADLRAKLQIERAKFVESLEAYREEIQTNAEAVKRHFIIAAKGFLFEDSGLSWSPIRSIVGQAGGMDPVEYPAFAVELSGSDFVGLQRRSSPNQVSESQREFIDLAFRMALIAVASPASVGTLAVDAPESSLDAVFVDKAAKVLGEFANSGTGNRLILTSNLGAGELVPELLMEVTPQGERMAPVVNLFEAGVPTRAMIDSKDSYDHYWAKLRQRVDG